MNSGYRCFVVLFAPAKFPARAANGPRTETDWRNIQIRCPESFCFHVNHSLMLPKLLRECACAVFVSDSKERVSNDSLGESEKPSPARWLSPLVGRIVRT